MKSWPLESLANFNEWTSAFFYGTDIVMLLLFALWALRVKWNFKFSVSNVFLFVFLLIASLSLIVAENKFLGLFRLVKLVEFTTLFLYLKSALGKIFNFSNIFTAIFFSGLFQAFIAITQALSQRSLGLKWLGESVLSTNFNGVAVVATEGGKFLRSYGTFPHPNVFAAWLFISIFAFYFWYLLSPPRNRPSLRRGSEKGHWIALIAYAFLLVGFLFSFSRVAIGLWIVGLAAGPLWVLLKRKKYKLESVFKKRMTNLLAVSSMIVVIFSFFYWPQVESRFNLSTDNPAISERIFYNKIASDTMLSRSILGLGVGQFVWSAFADLKLNENYLYQPVHNIYLLVASENGIIGIAVFLTFIFAVFADYIKKTGLATLRNLYFMIVAVSILSMGLFDHFLWTIQQGQIILWSMLALLVNLADRQQSNYGKLF